jgi:hypothetical protein
MSEAKLPYVCFITMSPTCNKYGSLYSVARQGQGGLGAREKSRRWAYSLSWKIGGYSPAVFS